MSEDPPRHARSAESPEPAAAGDSARLTVIVVVFALVVGATVLGAWWVSRDDGPEPGSQSIAAGRSGPADGDGSATDAGADGQQAAGPEPTSSPTATPAPTPTATPVPFEGFSDPARVGTAYSDEVDGLITFRGNPTRTFYGEGMPEAPSLQWSYPPGRVMCGPSTVGSETTQWCGTGWTGQPSVFEHEGRTWAVFGAYDHDVHFVDADTGEDILPAFPTGDIIKGSVTIDPDGYPIVYSGSRDDFFHVIAIDRDAPVELWRLDADAIPGAKWNNDWDGSAIVLDDYLFEGGENSVFHVVKLNRGYDADGFVTVDPELVFTAPGYDDDLLATVGTNVSIENSVAVWKDIVYFANSGGLVQGWDVSGVPDGRDPERVFRFWVGDDVDASIVVDERGFLYVGAEYERGFSRSHEVGQLVKLNPRRPNDPVVWSVFDTGELPDGVWATPALHDDVVIVPTDSGRLIGVDRRTGDIRWEKRLPGPLWSSPVVVDGVLLQGDCEGTMHAYDVSDTTVDPPQIWSVTLRGCIESTPAVWRGRIIFGTRAGQVHMIG